MPFIALLLCNTLVHKTGDEHAKFSGDYYQYHVKFERIHKVQGHRQKQKKKRERKKKKKQRDVSV